MKSVTNKEGFWSAGSLSRGSNTGGDHTATPVPT